MADASVASAPSPGPSKAATPSHPAPPSSRDSARLTCPGVPLPSNYESLPVLSRPAIAERITRGELLVLHPPLVYRVPHAWLTLHPGGHHSILHYVGRDASCEIEAYHTGRTVQQRMARWAVGRVEVDDDDETLGEGWRDMTPPIQLGMWPIPLPKITVTASSPPVSPARSRSRLATTTTAAVEASSGKATEEARVLTPAMVDPPLAREDYAALPLTPSYQAHLRRSHKRLHERIHALGLDTPPPFLAGYGPSLVLYSALAALSVWAYRRAQASGSAWDWVLAAVFLGAFWHQITFVAHDTGHTALTGDWWTDRLWGVAIADFMGGLSIGWWCDNHNVHHLVTNAPEHDPDIQHLPFFAISTRFLEGIRSTYYDRLLVFDAFAKKLLPHQHKLYYVVMSFARFNLFALSYGFLLTRWPSRQSPLFKLRLLELVGIACFWTWFGRGVLGGIPGMRLRLLYLVVSFAVTSPLHVQIVLSHFSQPISIVPPSSSPASSPLPPSSLELLESHPHRQLRTTMDVSCPPYLDFLHGGLNFQTPHHLFPRIPRFRFRAVARVIERWVADEAAQLDERAGDPGRKYWRGVRLGEHEGLEYKKMDFVQGNRSVLGVLRDVGDQVRLLAKVAEKEARGEGHHHH